MHDTLAKVVQAEANKLLTESAGTDPLASDRLDALEKLCRCVRALKVEQEDPPEEMPTDTEAELALVDKVRG